MKPQFLIAAPSSGTGKTTVTQGLLRILRNRSIKVQPFKCGPDYLDTRHHQWAASRPSINLDIFMSSTKHVQQIYSQNLQNADASIVEGVMGLFDGSRGMEGSSAQISELLNIPVILVVNAKATAYSVAPLLYGFKNFYPGIKLKGVIFNFVNTPSHYQFLKDACADVGVTPLGYIPRNEELILPSRHLGLSTSPSNDYESIIEKIAHHMSKTVDVDKLLSLCMVKNPSYSNTSSQTQGSLNIAVARDEAFSFTYEQNLKVLHQMGKVTFFSPLHDKTIPKADIMYLAGGYPELYLNQLSQNIHMKKSILQYCEQGGKMIAECGGMMYLCNNIIDKQGVSYPMVGFLNQDASMQQMKLHLGYRKIIIGEQEYRGHEFHYSHLSNFKEESNIATVSTARDKIIETPVFHKKNTLASYIHFYWGEKNIINELLNS